jgi:uncharacterized low-complexity protein
MSDNTSKLKLASAVGAALAGAMILGGNAQAFENPFSMRQLEGGYMQLAVQEGSCGGNKVKEGNCGESKQPREGNCGGDKAMSAEEKAKEGKCGSNNAMATGSKVKEGKCGEAKCGANKK